MKCGWDYRWQGVPLRLMYTYGSAGPSVMAATQSGTAPTSPTPSLSLTEAKVSKLFVSRFQLKKGRHFQNRCRVGAPPCLCMPLAVCRFAIASPTARSPRLLTRTTGRLTTWPSPQSSRTLSVSSPPLQHVRGCDERSREAVCECVSVGALVWLGCVQDLPS